MGRAWQTACPSMKSRTRSSGRSGWAGIQRYPVSWSGDQLCNYPSMLCTVWSGLGYGLSGVAFWSHDLGGFGNAFVWLGRHEELIFEPIRILLITQLFQVGRVIGIIIDGRHRADLMKSIYQHTFAVHIGEPERPVDGLQAAFPGPIFDSSKQPGWNFRVVDKVDPAEAQVGLFPLLDVSRVEDSSDPPDNLPIFIIRNNLRLLGMSVEAYLDIQARL